MALGVPRDGVEQDGDMGPGRAPVFCGQLRVGLGRPVGRCDDVVPFFGAALPLLLFAASPPGSVVSGFTDVKVDGRLSRGALEACGDVWAPFIVAGFGGGGVED